MLHPHALACGLLLTLSAAPCFAAAPSADEQRLAAVIDADGPFRAELDASGMDWPADAH